jgi:S-adenosylmethionine/arginine decarboxylase-like enzyme
MSFQAFAVYAGDAAAHSSFLDSQPGRLVGIVAGLMDSNTSPASFTADLSGCAALRELVPHEVAALFMGALDRAGGTIVEAVSHAFPATGLTCVLILRESHAVLHTWPETGTVNIDIFSCSTRLQSLAAIAEVGRSLGATAVSIQESSRADGHGPQSERRG